MQLTHCKKKFRQNSSLGEDCIRIRNAFCQELLRKQKKNMRLQKIPILAKMTFHEDLHLSGGERMNAFSQANFPKKALIAVH
ncbi:MAG: hypothetical protein QNJ46_22700 [Leptolyngbyaceae cyanobacterium MO_188.B28]|nr:hypothetical protein [Leptolyngbyaceae cyanobacterium MO_188.B28]